MDHPNIVKFYSCQYDNKYINIVMELVNGMPLSDYLLMKKIIPEDECKLILYHVMCAIKYFHSKGIVHRDLKLDNIMISGYESGDITELKVKLIDFGMSKLTQGNKKINLSTYCGTIDFIAPEVLEGTNYDQKCDIWSIGVIAFFLLSGVPPFMGKDEVEIERNISSCNFGFEKPIWKTISKDAKSWIDKMLELRPADRFSPEKALAHVWL